MSYRWIGLVGGQFLQEIVLLEVSFTERHVLEEDMFYSKTCFTGGHVLWAGMSSG